MNGWMNEETYVVHFWNHAEDHEFRLRYLAQNIPNRLDAIDEIAYLLQVRLEQQAEKLIPAIDRNNALGEVLSIALSRVDWQALATHWYDAHVKESAA